VLSNCSPAGAAMSRIEEKHMKDEISRSRSAGQAGLSGVLVWGAIIDHLELHEQYNINNKYLTKHFASRKKSVDQITVACS
jgi:hypothetical protein